MDIDAPGQAARTRRLKLNAGFIFPTGGVVGRLCSDTTRLSLRLASQKNELRPEISLTLGRDDQLLAGKNVVRIFEYVFVRFKDFHVLAAVAVELRGNFPQCVT